jgi:hypothetical protein
MPTNKRWVLKRRPKGEIKPGDALDAVGRLFSGDHEGKLLVRVSPEP